MRTRAASVAETVVSIAIFLVVIQAALEDVAIAAQLPAAIRNAIAVSAVFFDLFFTVEFLIRLTSAAGQGRTGLYLTKERGWIDFLASVPLLVFSSGPVAIAWLAGASGALALGNLLNLLKVIKAIRIARILRLLRIAKIFRSIKYAQSPMAQRHMANVTAIAISVLVGGLMLVSTIAAVVEMPGLEAAFAARPALVGRALEQSASTPTSLDAAVATTAAADPGLLLVKLDGSTRYSRYDNATYATAFGSGDYACVRQETPSGGLLEVYYDLRTYHAQAGRESLLYLFIVLMLVLVLLLVYSPHFAMTVSDPIHVMSRGMAESGYNLTVRVPERYAEDDVFELARHYNEVFLPMKDLAGGERHDSVLSMESSGLGELLGEGTAAKAGGG
jgi:hypothetical protein